MDNFLNALVYLTPVKTLTKGCGGFTKKYRVVPALILRVIYLEIQGCTSSHIAGDLPRNTGLFQLSHCGCFSLKYRLVPALILQVIYLEIQACTSSHIAGDLQRNTGFYQLSCLSTVPQLTCALPRRRPKQYHF